MNDETKTFGLGPILTIMHGPFMCEMGEVYDILNWVTDDNLMTHQLPRAGREVEPFLKQLYPDLVGLEVPEWTEIDGWGELDSEDKEARITEWLDTVGEQVGATRDVPQMKPEDHTMIDPISELKMMRPDAEIIAVEVPE